MLLACLGNASNSMCIYIYIYIYHLLCLKCEQPLRKLHVLFSTVLPKLGPNLDL